MIWFVGTIHVIVCFVLIGVVLLQQGKSADLAYAFGGQGSQTAFGPRGAANLLTKVTTWAAIIFMFTSIGLTVLIPTYQRPCFRALGHQNHPDHTRGSRQEVDSSKTSGGSTGLASSGPPPLPASPFPEKPAAVRRRGP